MPALSSFRHNPSYGSLLCWVLAPCILPCTLRPKLRPATIRLIASQARNKVLDSSVLALLSDA